MPKDLPRNRFNSLSIPEEYGNMTINELMNHPDTDVIKHGNRVSIRRRTKDGVATLDLQSYDTGRREAKLCAVPKREYKKDYKQDIQEMKRQGMSQKDIAFELGISEAYVSRILRN